jgi:hypothetical protein
MFKKNTACDPNKVERCTAELHSTLSALALQHTAMIVAAALAEHVRGGLAISQHAKACKPRAVRAIIERLRAAALAT